MLLQRKSRALLSVGVISAVAAIAVACGSDEPAAVPTSTPVPEPTATPSPQPTATTEPHDHTSHHHGPVESSGMSVDINLEVDAASGVNLEIVPTGFEFTPRNVNLDHIDGEGHAHVYVNGVKLGRVYDRWVHIDGLEPGDHNIAVTLNANTHADYTSGGAPVIVSKTVTVPDHSDANGHGHGHSGHADGVEAEGPMSVQVSAEPDAASGANVFITVDGFKFTPENVNEDHVDGEGHAHIYVDGKKVGRLYGSSVHLGDLSEGEHEIRVTLNSNTHADYTVDGQVVEAVTTVNVEKGGEPKQDSHGHDHHDDDHGHMSDDSHGDDEKMQESHGGDAHGS